MQKGANNTPCAAPRCAVPDADEVLRVGDELLEVFLQHARMLEYFTHELVDVVLLVLHGSSFYFGVSIQGISSKKMTFLLYSKIRRIIPQISFFFCWLPVFSVRNLANVK